MFKTLKLRGLFLLPTLLCGLLFTVSGNAGAAPTLEMGKPENYCVVYCYIRVPFTVKDYGGSGQKIGRVFCDFDVDVTAALPVYQGETRTKSIKTSTIGVFKTLDGKGQGDAEINTGIIKNYFINGKANSIRCHL